MYDGYQSSDNESRADLTPIFDPILYLEGSKVEINQSYRVTKKVYDAREQGVYPKYHLACAACGKRMMPTYSYECTCHDALIRTQYNGNPSWRSKMPGLWQYIEWMPCETSSDVISGPVTYKSEGLARALGLSNLHISFNGYWPEKGAAVFSGNFKEYEAILTLQRMKEFGVTRAVIASSGNTARAFGYVAQFYDIPVITVIPEKNLANLWMPSSGKRKAVFVTVKDGDYADAIKMAGRICNSLGCVIEGGVRSVARRDGIAVIIMDAAFSIGEIPKHYFQAIGSGTGAIAIYEGVRRLEESGYFGMNGLKLHLAQNLPFAPVARAWARGAKQIDPDQDMPSPDESISEVVATMLTNRNPPYSITGGVYDVLRATQGQTYMVSNAETREAQALFEQVEGRDIVPEAGVAIAALKQAAQKGTISKDDCVLLNISGGGLNSIFKDLYVSPPRADVTIHKSMNDAQLRKIFNGVKPISVNPEHIKTRFQDHFCRHGIHRDQIER
jgi:cysteate synthase